MASNAGFNFNSDADFASDCDDFGYFEDDDDRANIADLREPDNPVRPGLQNLPPEVLEQITHQLSYPDALAMKQTCRRFRHFVDTSMLSKVLWMKRFRALGIPVQLSRRVNLRTDESFMRSGGIDMVRDYRAHLDCNTHADLGCVVQRRTWCTRRVRQASTFPELLPTRPRTWNKADVDTWPEPSLYDYLPTCVAFPILALVLPFRLASQGYACLRLLRRYLWLVRQRRLRFSANGALGAPDADWRSIWRPSLWLVWVVNWLLEVDYDVSELCHPSEQDDGGPDTESTYDPTSDVVAFADSPFADDAGVFEAWRCLAAQASLADWLRHTPREHADPTDEQTSSAGTSDVTVAATFPLPDTSMWRWRYAKEETARRQRTGEPAGRPRRLTIALVRKCLSDPFGRRTRTSQGTEFFLSQPERERGGWRGMRALSVLMTVALLVWWMTTRPLSNAT